MYLAKLCPSRPTLEENGNNRCNIRSSCCMTENSRSKSKSDSNSFTLCRMCRDYLIKEYHSRLVHS